ncbi:MAG: hypothetical protein ACOCWA_07080, partial [Bacteroidota bacterium]
IYKQDSSKYHEIEFFKSSLLKNLGRFTHTENVVLKEMTYQNPSKENQAEDFSHALSKDRQNIVILPEEQDQAFVSTVITQLYFQLRDYDVQVFGLPHFSRFTKEFQYFHSLKLRYLSPFHYDYQDEQIIRFLDHYSSHFDAEPHLETRKGCSYAFIGHDLTYYFIKSVYTGRRNFVSRLNELQIDNLLPSFYFVRKSRYGGFENQTLKLVTYSKDFEVISRDTRLVTDPDPAERLRRLFFEREVY